MSKGTHTSIVFMRPAFRLSTSFAKSERLKSPLPWDPVCIFLPPFDLGLWIKEFISAHHNSWSEEIPYLTKTPFELTSDKLYDIRLCMKTNVTTLLRDFPKVRRAAMAGEVVIIQTREGNLRLTADREECGSLVGCLRGKIRSDKDLDAPTSDWEEWGPK